MPCADDFQSPGRCQASWDNLLKQSCVIATENWQCTVPSMRTRPAPAKSTESFPAPPCFCRKKWKFLLKVKFGDLADWVSNQGIDKDPHGCE